MYVCGFFFCKVYFYLGVILYDVFICLCCGFFCIEYKCFYLIKDLIIEEEWEKIDFFEIDEKLCFKRLYKYYFKLNGNL